MKNANKKTVDITTSILKEKNLKVTVPRLEILSTLVKNKKPLSIEEIKSKIDKKINTTTIYRTLEKLVEKQVVYQTDFRDNKAYFEFQKNHHHHIICIKCGEREEINLCIKNRIEKIKNDSKNFKTINSHVLELFGECNKCTT